MGKSASVLERLRRGQGEDAAWEWPVKAEPDQCDVQLVDEQSETGTGCYFCHRVGLPSAIAQRERHDEEEGEEKHFCSSIELGWTPAEGEAAYGWCRQRQLHDPGARPG